MGEEIRCVKYVAVRKSKCEPGELKLSYRELETLVEMGMDYLEILKEMIKEIGNDNGYKKALYKYKIDEISKITNYIANEISYSKKCSKTKEREETGLDAFSATIALRDGNS